MIIQTGIPMIFYKLFLLILSAIYSISGGVVAPSTETPIQPKNPDAVQMVFVPVADPQVSNYLYSRYPVFEASCMDLKNAACQIDAIVGVGDIVENGLADEYQLIFDKLSGIPGTRYIMASGNHDIRLRIYDKTVERFTGFVNALNGDDSVDALHYSEVINGYKIIVLGSDRTEFEEAYLSPEQLDWLDSELAGENGNPTFVICHQPLKDTHNLPEAWGSPIKSAGSVGKQSDELRAILASHDNVVFINGHLHSAFGEYTYEQVDGFASVNVPSLTVNDGQTYVVEVYEDEILFRARDLSKGVWLPDYDITIPVEHPAN